MPQIYNYFPNQPAKAKCVIESLHPFREISFVAFPMPHPAMQCIPPPHPLIEGFHGVFFQAVRFDFGLFNIFLLGRIPRSVPFLASHQQQGGQSRRCCKDDTFCDIFHFLILLLMNCCHHTTAAPWCCHGWWPSGCLGGLSGCSASCLLLSYMSQR